VANGVVYAASLFGNRVFAFDATTGETLWSARFEDSNSTPAIVNGVLYVGADDKALHAFSL
jgi:serine/threonine-protein kinase